MIRWIIRRDPERHRPTGMRTDAPIGWPSAWTEHNDRIPRHHRVDPKEPSPTGWPTNPGGRP